ncbi:phage protein, HK97 gp10 family [Aeromicrobium marinum DSM 15272]|uniref:Phage protein, HK97 gp10 family n=1 Tax=Aeromicrobium marinum DSM 15272 TaxID=585531 RepID=E2SDX8_9ACTN|nr:HK97-gp10 family putative phage morphogenesis protein [Aeromicrobium marinum]EFQ82705.1 phage protein, HK97 gp10 family [Aeromicrobium marinum DSM 15272]
MASFEFDGLQVIASDMKNAGKKAKRLVPLIVAKTTFDIEADAKIIVAVDTGNLMGSIGSDIDPDGLGSTIGPTADYGRFIEKGTDVMPAQPFMAPAFDRRAPGFVQAIEQMPKL